MLETKLIQSFKLGIFNAVGLFLGAWVLYSIYTEWHDSVYPPQVKVGQTWAIQFGIVDEDNPFEADEGRDTVRVLDIKGRYVKYAYLNSGTTSSWSLSELVSHGKLVENDQ